MEWDDVWVNHEHPHAGRALPTRVIAKTSTGSMGARKKSPVHTPSSSALRSVFGPQNPTPSWMIY
jgi:hypothetical protein